MPKKFIQKALARIRVLIDSDRWRRFYFQRLFMRKNIRDAVANYIAARRRPSYSHPLSSGTESQLEELNVDGLALLGHVLSREQCAELVEYFVDRDVADPYRPEQDAFRVGDTKTPQSSHIAHHFAEDVIRAPYLLDVANSREILSLAAAFLGCKPTISYVAAWWSFPTSLGPQQAELFHRDVDDWRFLKLFVYLTDVGENDGPHVYVRKSAPSPKLNRIARFTDAQVESAFGKEQIEELCSAAGGGFLENTFGVHRGLPPQTGKRLMFQVVYSLSELPYGPESSLFASDLLEDMGFDSWTNRVYFSG
jgi:hypothetical protein